MSKSNITKGTKVKITMNGSHSFGVGDIVEITKVTSGPGQKYQANHNPTGWLYRHEFELIDALTYDEIIKQRDELLEALKNLTEACIEEGYEDFSQVLKAKKAIKSCES